MFLPAEWISSSNTHDLQDGDNLSCSLERCGTIRYILSKVNFGIDKKHLERILVDGLQFDPSLLQVGHASTLGLFIAKEIIERHGGCISLFSESSAQNDNGQGRKSDSSSQESLPTIIIELPAYLAPDQNRKPKRVVSNNSNAQKKKRTKPPLNNSTMKQSKAKYELQLDDAHGIDGSFSDRKDMSESSEGSAGGKKEIGRNSSSPQSLTDNATVNRFNFSGISIEDGANYTKKSPGMASYADIRRILVVDDAASNRKMLVRILISKGFECLEAVNGEEALNIYVRERNVLKERLPYHSISSLPSNTSMLANLSSDAATTSLATDTPRLDSSSLDAHNMIGLVRNRSVSYQFNTKEHDDIEANNAKSKNSVSVEHKSRANNQHSAAMYDGVDEPFGAILMDFEMPVMNGPTSTKHLRQMGCECIIVGISGNVLPEDVNFFLSQGANKVLPKPLQFENLMEIWEAHHIPSLRSFSDGGKSEESSEGNACSYKYDKLQAQRRPCDMSTIDELSSHSRISDAESDARSVHSLSYYGSFANHSNSIYLVPDAFLAAEMHKIVESSDENSSFLDGLSVDETDRHSFDGPQSQVEKKSQKVRVPLLSMSLIHSKPGGISRQSSVHSTVTPPNTSHRFISSPTDCDQAPPHGHLGLNSESSASSGTNANCYGEEDRTTSAKDDDVDYL